MLIQENAFENDVWQNGSHFVQGEMSKLRVQILNPGILLINYGKLIWDLFLIFRC